MNRTGRPNRNRAYLLGTALLLAAVIYFTVPGSLTYVLIGLLVVLHFGMHGAHGHGAHDAGGNGAARRAPRDGAAPEGDRATSRRLTHAPHAAHAVSATLATPSSAGGPTEVAPGTPSAGDEPDTHAHPNHDPSRHGRHGCC